MLSTVSVLLNGRYLGTFAQSESTERRDERGSCALTRHTTVPLVRPPNGNPVRHGESPWPRQRGFASLTRTIRTVNPLPSVLGKSDHTPTEAVSADVRDTVDSATE